MSKYSKRYAHLDDLIQDVAYHNKYLSNTKIAYLIKDKLFEDGEISEYEYNNFKIQTLRKHVGYIVNDFLRDKEVVETNVKLAKQKQKLQDTQRIERKSFREHARIENALEEYAKALTDQYKDYGESLKKQLKSKPRLKRKGNGVGVMQITDVHGNELIDLPHNQYNFDILSKRMRLYVNECLAQFEFDNVKSVLICFTGDLLNSDRRLDELLNQSTNRAKATLLMQHIISQAILEVLNAGYKVSIVNVLGNESRANKEMSFSNEGLSDNYDLSIIGGVKNMFELADIKGVTWGEIDKVETVVNVNGMNWLICHDIDKKSSKQDKTQSAFGRYSLQNIKLQFMIGGHIHATRVTDISARSGSMSGSNSYNENALNLAGTASANCYIVTDRIKTIVHNLQNVDNVEGYEIESGLEAYNIKSKKKTYTGTTVFKVVI